MRKIIQVISVTSPTAIIALCDDGALFGYTLGDPAKWEPLPGIPQPLEEPPATPGLDPTEPEPRHVFGHPPLPDGFWRCYSCGLSNANASPHCRCGALPLKLVNP